MPPSKRILLGVTGSIAAYRAADIIRELQRRDCDVTVVMTSEAEAFITPLTLASLSGKAVHRSMLDQESDAWTMPHIRLAQNTDRILIAPATANVIGKLAHGLADDLLTTTLISATAPIWIAPAMNDEMYKNRIVQENCSRLKAMGIQFIEPVEGKLACGTSGVGHLADIQTIVDAVCA